MTDAKAPHKAVILLNVEIHEVLSTGECSGKVLSDKELVEMGLKKHMTVSVNGFDKFECVKKLRELISQFEGK